MSDQKPIPFKAQPLEDTGARPGNPPTSLFDCMKIGGHGGADGSRWYYTNYPANKADAEGNVISHGKLGELTGDTRICEICGMVDI